MSKSNNEEEEEQYRKSIDGIARIKHVSVILPWFFYNKIILVVNKREEQPYSVYGRITINTCCGDFIMLCLTKTL